VEHYTGPVRSPVTNLLSINNSVTVQKGREGDQSYGQGWPMCNLDLMARFNDFINETIAVMLVAEYRCTTGLKDSTKN
jgi:hypothetical protein